MRQVLLLSLRDQLDPLNTRTLRIQLTLESLLRRATSSLKLEAFGVSKLMPQSKLLNETEGFVVNNFCFSEVFWDPLAQKPASQNYVSFLSLELFSQFSSFPFSGVSFCFRINAQTLSGVQNFIISVRKTNLGRFHPKNGKPKMYQVLDEHPKCLAQFDYLLIIQETWANQEYEGRKGLIYSNCL